MTAYGAVKDNPGRHERVIHINIYEQGPCISRHLQPHITHHASLCVRFVYVLHTCATMRSTVRLVRQWTLLTVSTDTEPAYDSGRITGQV